MYAYYQCPDCKQEISGSAAWCVYCGCSFDGYKNPEGRWNEPDPRVFLPWSQKTSGERWSEVCTWVIVLPVFYVILAISLDIGFGIELPFPD